MFLSSLLTGVMYCLFFAVVYKVFSLSNELNELKDLLREIRRNTNPAGSYAAQRDEVEKSYVPPDLNALAAEIDREEKAYEVPADRVSVIDPPRQ
jgi:hypothetical protein